MTEATEPGDAVGASATVVLKRDRGWHEPAAEVLALTPNPRAASALGVAPLSIERLGRRLLRRTRLLQAPELAQWRTLRDAVGEVWSADDVDGTTRAVAGTVREVLRAGLAYVGTAPAGLSAATAPSQPAPPSNRDQGRAGVAGASPLAPRAARVVALATVYREKLLGRRLVDPAETLWWVVRGGAGGALRPIRQRLHVAGYPRLGAAEVAFLAAVAAPGSVLELPDGDDALYAGNRATATELGEHGWTVVHGEEPAPTAPEADGRAVTGGPTAAAPGTMQAFVFASQDAEVRHVLTEVKRLLAGASGTAVSPDEIVLVARDDAAYGPLVKAVAWEYQIPVVTSYALPVRDTRVGAWTATLMEVVRNDLPFEATARLLSHPLTTGMNRASWDRARSTHATGAAAWRDIEARSETLVWPSWSSRGALLDHLRAVWETYGLADLAGSRVDDGLAFHTLAAAAAGLGLPAEESVSLDAFATDLDALLSLVTVPTDAGRAGVALHTPLAVFGARYRHVFILGAAEGVLPQLVRDDAVLDFYGRRSALAAGLPLEGAVEAARRERLSFEAVLWTVAPGGSLSLSFPTDLGIASPVFRELALVPTAPGPKPPASDEERRRQRIMELAEATEDAVLAAARHALQVERRREEERAPDMYDGVVGEPYDLASHMFSATQLLDLGQCPFRWFAKVPLRLAEPEEAEDDVSPLLRGRLYHRVLATVLRRAIEVLGPAADAGAVREAALELLEEAFLEAEQQEHAADLPNWSLRRAEHLHQLAIVLRSETFLPEGTQVVELEQAFPADRRAALWHGVPVRGRLDRADVRAGGLVLIDYKTAGSTPKGVQEGDGRLTLDLQLPLYLQAAAPALFPDAVVAGAQYYSLSTIEVLKQVVVDDDLDVRLEAFADRSRRRFQAGAYPVAPDVAFDACRYCDFDLVCRRGPRIARMRAAGTLDDDGHAGEDDGRKGAADPRGSGERVEEEG